MMIDEEECREVAARLAREAQAWRGTFPDSECADINAAAMIQDLCVFVGLGRSALCSEVFQRLADLIDRPTCKNIADPYDGSFFECSKCGERWELACGSPADNNLNFCPRCGAEVVS